MGMTGPLPIARYRFTLRCETPLWCNEYPGSMLRGAFGYALRAVSCMTGRAECGGCDMQRSCRYPALFEPAPVVDERGQRRNIPAPYIIEAERRMPERLEAGSPFVFDMVLFGPALDQLPTIIMAWQRAAYSGLGPKLARCRLEQVAQVAADGQQPVVFREDSPRVAPHDANLSVPTLPAASSLVLMFDTSTRLQHRGKLAGARQLTGPILLNALARKVELYTRHYTSTAWQRPALPETLALKAELKRQPWQRYSNRQKRVIRLDGLVGRVEVSGDLHEWLPWFWLGQYTHVGKNTSFGLGRYQLAQQVGACSPAAALAY